MKATLAGLAAGLAMASAVVAQDGDAAKGQALAGEHCARCHDIGPGGGFKTFPPSFASIAVFRAPDQITARIWFPALHASMPAMENLLMAEDVADLTAYIVSLDKAR